MPGLVTAWMVTVSAQVIDYILVNNQLIGHLGQLSLAIPAWVYRCNA